MKQIKWMPFLIISVLGLKSWSQSARILQVKGNQAIVELKDVDLAQAVKGMTYNLNSEKISRASLIELSGSIENNSTKTGSSTNSGLILDLTTRWGYNKMNAEYGLLLNYSMDQRETSKFSSLAGGLFFDYNMIPNKSGTSGVYGAGLQALTGMIKIGNSSDIAFYEAFPYAFYKWFINAQNVALSSKLGYEIISKNTNPKIEESNLKLVFGLSYYY